MSADVIAVGIGTLGQARQEFTLEAGSTVADLLEAADMSGEGFTFKVAGNGEVSSSYELQNGDVVALIPAVKNGI